MSGQVHAGAPCQLRGCGPRECGARGDDPWASPRSRARREGEKRRVVPAAIRGGPTQGSCTAAAAATKEVPPPSKHGTDPSHLSHVSRTPVQVNIERKPGDEPPITPWESRTSACVEAAKLVQLYCVGAAEDKGMAEAAPFLEALHCTNVLRG
eukprot:1186328-Prorocentrum_minimum.AAC.3